jgi:cytochrome c oxidase cbb3-type subunit III
MGPPLMDAAWRYGSAPKNVYASITEGRPNGMPSFRARLTEGQTWQLVAYVRSMSGLLDKDVAPGRDDGMQVRSQEQGMEKVP